MSILILAEHNNQQLLPATLHVIGAAQVLTGEISLLVAGYQCDAVVAQAEKIPGVKQVMVADAVAYQHQFAENVSKLIVEIAPNYRHILAAATTTGKNILPRVAALLAVSPISDVLAIETQQRFQRAIYAGNAIATVETTAPINVMTIRTTAFDAVASHGGAAVRQTLSSQHQSADVEFCHASVAVSDRPELTAAKIVVSGGRGLGNGENFSLLYQLADNLGAAVGASRAAVDAGFVANDLQVGQTGKLVAPDLYIAVGISGAIQHLAGMKDAKVIVAINKDEDAPIFQIADYGLVADLFTAIPELNKSF